ncbi:hypothetical protein FVEG_10431 [Fusarium verticillioides 7600]|uniref:Uncharacterized protein n=1 Tax=Gibberella moniliformis (strain M3125 / FGSC 7600) TaxID=334819 RepID=W7N4D2_GIBM7|nr:hypothetical protein FVEG_10431 [Fusarium verticillioides 7600]EWG51477.1 hypothetical protein FVEG_10431 [Fusarium verticillioides 7600]
MSDRLEDIHLEDCWLYSQNCRNCTAHATQVIVYLPLLMVELSSSMLPTT